MINVALVGYGKMGRMIESLAGQYDAAISHRLDIGWKDADLAARPDAAIEFSTPEAAVENLERLAGLGIPTVCGTTGWFAQFDRVKAAFERQQAALVYSANYSIGVNVFQRLAAEAAVLLKDEAMYEAWAWEIHHSAKKDAPSGTLLQLTAAMRAAGYSRRIDESSNRAGAHPGTHEIGFDSAADTITLRHTARSREGFARGALKAATWIKGKRGVHAFADVLFGTAQ
jgi:4-hydroxy-tetrahydrodipicolinate reductase